MPADIRSYGRTGQEGNGIIRAPSSPPTPPLAERPVSVSRVPPSTSAVVRNRSVGPNAIRHRRRPHRVSTPETVPAPSSPHASNVNAAPDCHVDCAREERACSSATSTTDETGSHLFTVLPSQRDGSFAASGAKTPHGSDTTRLAVVKVATETSASGSTVGQGYSGSGGNQRQILARCGARATQGKPLRSAPIRVEIGHRRLPSGGSSLEIRTSHDSPAPRRHRRFGRYVRARLRVYDREPRSPFEVGHQS